MLYDQLFIDDLKRQADIVRVVQDYVPLKKMGTSWKACCPFHQEKTPSFNVNPSKGVFKCFGCGKGGSAFNFIMEIEGVSFPEAIKILAEKMSIPLPKPIDDKKYVENQKKYDAKKKEADEVIELNAFALEFWENHLLEENNAEARTAREYLERRGITDETRKAFRLGYSPNSWDALMSFLKAKDVSEAQLERSGLLSKNEEKHSIYDRFRGRLMFPVLDAMGKPIAFGARILEKGEPKYLNSPETAAYTKGKNLYGLFQNKAEIKQKKFVILVEGYLDLITPYQNGVRNLVASLGTAFTPEQAKLLARFARKIVVNYDGDSAGVKAAKRAIEPLLAEDFEVKILVLPDGADPDDFIRANGAEAYHTSRGKAVTHFSFILEQAVKSRNLLHPNDKAVAIEETLPFVRAVRNPIQKRDYFDQAMSFLRVEDAMLKRDLWKTIKLGANVESSDIRKQIARTVQLQPTVSEQNLLEMLFQDKELRQIILPQLEETDYDALATAAIFRRLLELEHNGAALDFNNFTELMNEDVLASDLVPMLLMGEPLRGTGEPLDEFLNQAEKCLLGLRLMAIDRLILGNNLELVNAEQSNDFERLTAIVDRQIQLGTLKRTIEKGLTNNG